MQNKFWEHGIEKNILPEELWWHNHGHQSTHQGPYIFDLSCHGEVNIAKEKKEKRK